MNKDEILNKINSSEFQKFIKSLPSSIEIINHSFVCPKCESEYDDNENNYSTIQIRGKKLSSRSRVEGRLILRTEIHEVYHLKICKKCMKRRKIGKICIWVTLLFIIPVLLLLLEEYSAAVTSSFMGLIIALIINANWDSDIDINNAAKNNAIAFKGPFGI